MAARRRWEPALFQLAAAFKGLGGTPATRRRVGRRRGSSCGSSRLAPNWKEMARLRGAAKRCPRAVRSQAGAERRMRFRSRANRLRVFECAGLRVPGAISRAFDVRAVRAEPCQPAVDVQQCLYFMSAAGQISVVGRIRIRIRPSFRPKTKTTQYSRSQVSACNGSALDLCINQVQINIVRFKKER